MYSDIFLQVKLRESALAEIGLPVKCVHGKVARLVIKVSHWCHYTKYMLQTFIFY